METIIMLYNIPICLILRNGLEKSSGLKYRDYWTHQTHAQAI